MLVCFDESTQYFLGAITEEVDGNPSVRKVTYDDGQKEVILISDVNVCILDKDADAKHQCKLASNKIRRAKVKNKKRREEGLPALPLVKTGLPPLKPVAENAVDVFKHQLKFVVFGLLTKKKSM